MAETYANCRTYRDSGRSMAKLDAEGAGTVFFKPFQTAFARLDRFRFACTMQAPAVHPAWIVWCQGPVVRSWDWKDGHQKPETLASALAEIAGVSGGVSMMVPRLLMPQVLPGPSLAQLPDAERLDDEDIDNAHCYRIRGNLGTARVTIWIDQQSNLILRQVREHDIQGGRTEEVTTYEPVLDEDVPPDALALGAP